MKGVDNVCLLILEVLERHANKEHRLLQKEIIGYIESDYGYTVHRNFVFLKKCIDRINNTNDADNNNKFISNNKLSTYFSRRNIIF